jgi:hypothetical protein
LTDEDGKEVNILYDKNRHEVTIKKEGIHFDLAHRNRIEWSLNNIEDFRKRLEERIKAIIV